MSLFKNIFSKDKPAPRKITQVNDLITGDIIQLTDSFALPEILREQQFEVSAVNSYEFEHQTETEWVLTGNSDHQLFLSLDIDDVVYLKFAIKIEHNDVETLFDLDQFSLLFEEPGNATLDRIADNDNTSQWSDQQYHQRIFAQIGYFHRKDHRSESLSPFEGKEAGEQLERYQLLNQDEDKGIEAEVWTDGDTDIFLTLYRPTTDIIDMYPGS
ncbi:hypothetical protein [Thalassotalea sp. PP2-459]|uniref:hypothetical protein n=1 Tax=Thalassotalea sp. PP2-459 TaxID=1742724 RepID=UPI000945A573|nr:hypothetical protein [Thalassotalea sp. PP2-459]OKY25063.1 hypothetical protein BI291_17315 [Thalassotalea sp. PP2-459]